MEKQCLQKQWCLMLELQIEWKQLSGGLHHAFIIGRRGMFSIEFAQYQDMLQNEAHKVISN